MERVVVVGATGFIGSRLVQHLLSQGHVVDVSLHRRSRWEEPLPVRRTFRSDITDSESIHQHFEGVDVVYHLAGATLARTAEEYHRVNVAGTKNVAAACAACRRPPRLVYVSSIAAAGPTTPDEPLTESRDARPVSNYGRSKRDAEVALQPFADDVSISIVRPPSVIGARDPYLLDLFRWAIRGWVFVPINRLQRYSFIHVDDLAAVLPRIAADGNSITRADAVPGLYHVADPEVMTFGEFAATVARAVNRPLPRTVVLPRAVCRFAGLGGELADRLTGKRPIVNLDKIREGLAGSWLCSTEKLIASGLYDFPYSLSERIAETVRDYQRLGKL